MSKIYNNSGQSPSSIGGWALTRMNLGRYWRTITIIIVSTVVVTILFCYRYRRQSRGLRRGYSLKMDRLLASETLHLLERLEYFELVAVLRAVDGL
jgi:hypothetical protein